MSNRQSNDNRCGCSFAKGTQTLTDKPKTSAKKKAAPKDPVAASRKASQKLLKTVTECLEDAKAEDVIAIDVGKKTSVADHMVIASGRSQRHVSAISDQLSRSLKEAGIKGAHSEDQHASFTVLVAEEVTASKHSPFHKAIKPLFKRWRDNLREEFKKTFSRQQAPHKSPERD